MIRLQLLGVGTGAGLLKAARLATRDFEDSDDFAVSRHLIHSGPSMIFGSDFKWRCPGRLAGSRGINWR